MKDPREMTDDELYEALKQADLSDRFLESPQGKLIKVAASRIVDRAVDKFALTDANKNVEELIELKIIIRKYKYGLFEEIEMLREDGYLAWQELKNRQPEPSDQDSLNTTEKGDTNG